MQLSKPLPTDSKRYGWSNAGVACLLLLVVFFVGQAITQLHTTATYSMRDQSISALGITTCENFTEPQTQQHFYVCSPYHLVMDGTFVVCGLLTMLAATLAISPRWPGKKLRRAGIILVFFGGIEEVVAGFSPLNLNPFLHSLSGGLAILALNIGLVLLGFAAIKKQPILGRYTLFWGTVGMVGLALSGTPPYVWLGYGGWERVAGYAFPLWGIGMAVSWLIRPKNNEL